MTTKTDVTKILEVTATIADVPIQIKEVVDDWLLLTFDIPKSEEGDKVRAEFLKNAWRHGAVQHTESVYLMPWTPDVTSLVIGLADVKNARVVAWHTTPADPALAIELTLHYDNRMSQAIEEVEERTQRIVDHLKGKHLKRAGSMAERSFEMLNALETVIRRRGSQRLLDDINRVRRDLSRQMALAWT